MKLIPFLLITLALALPGRADTLLTRPTATGADINPGADYIYIAKGNGSAEWKVTPTVLLTDAGFTGTSTGTNTGDQDLGAYALLSQVAASYQPLDADLSSIAAGTTTAYGRDILALANSAAARTYFQLGTLATQSGTFSGSHSGTSTGTNTGDQVSVTGNAGTATALATARQINTVPFDGTANITIPAAANTLTGTAYAAKDGSAITNLNAGSLGLGTVSLARLPALPATLGFGCSDLSTAITTGTGKGYILVPYNCTLTEIIVSGNAAPTGSVATFDINKNGTTMMTATKVTIDAGETDSTTAAAPAVLTTTALAKGDRVTCDFDGVGSTFGGSGIVVYLNVTRN